VQLSIYTWAFGRCVLSFSNSGMEHGLYQTKLAELAGVDEMTIVNWEKDRTVPRGSGSRVWQECLGSTNDNWSEQVLARGEHGTQNPFPPLRNLLFLQCFQIVSSKVFGTTWSRME